MNEEELLQKIADNIRKLRVSQGLTQMDVAAEMGIDKSAYQRLERGNANVTVSMLNKALIALESDFPSFFAAF